MNSTTTTKYSSFTRLNWILFAVASGVILIGYILLNQSPAEGFFSLTAAPLLLVLGYCVLIPVAILLGSPS